LGGTDSRTRDARADAGSCRTHSGGDAMIAKWAPDIILPKLLASLNDPAASAYGQVATLDEESEIHVRTVHLRHVYEFDTIGFAANRYSKKWKQLENGKLSGCYFDVKRMLQFRWRSDVECISAEAAAGLERKVVERMWGMVRPTVRTVYWYDHFGAAYDGPAPKGVDVAKVCPSFGVILCRPYFWDILEMPTEDYLTHRRSEHNLEKGKWISTPVSLLTGKPSKTK
jgi:hypothetical protein